MKNVIWITALIFLCSSALYAQHQSKQPKAGTATKQEPAATPDKRSSAQQSAADIPDAQAAASQVNENNDGSQKFTPERASNTPAVTQATSSGSGSPAVLSDNNGDGRDGTNNVQRASMNMAGAPANNIRLNDGRGSTASELKQRQDYTQEKQISAQNVNDKKNGTSAGAGNINNKSRRENNALSDQNLSSKNKKKQNQNSEGKSASKKKGRG